MPLGQAGFGFTSTMTAAATATIRREDIEHGRHLPHRKTEAVSDTPAAFVDLKGNLLIPDGSPLPEMLKTLPDAAFGEEVLPLFVRTPPNTVGSGELDAADVADIYEQAATLGIPAIGGDFLAGVEEYRKQLQLKASRIRSALRPSDSPAELIARLRGRARQLDNAGDGLGYYSRADAIFDREAADHIETLEARVATLEAEATKCQGCGVNDLGGCPRPSDKACWRDFHGGTRAAREASR